MISFTTTYRRNQIENYLFRAGAAPYIGIYYLGLFTSAPTIAGGGTEVSGNNYARVGCANLAANWTAPDANSKLVNAVAFAFPVPSAAWGNVVGVGIFDAIAAGNLLYYVGLNMPRAPVSPDTPTFAIGDLTLRLT